MSDTQNPTLIIRGGRVIDPANNIDRIADVAIAGDRIITVGDVPESAEAPVDGKSPKVIDAKGLLVTPGLVDIHTHVYHTKEPEGLSIVADHHMLRSGVTTVVDTGTSGAKHFLHFKRTVIDSSKVRIFAFVNIVKSGMIGPFEHELEEMDVELAASTVLAYPEIAVGIKTAHYWTHKPFDEAHTPWMSVDQALEASQICKKPVMVDFWPRPERTYPELLQKMQPGDIHTHVFAQQFPVLDENNKPNDHYDEASKRGIIFDLGHGGGSFWFRNAVPSIREGFLPHSISTDLHKGCVNGPVFTMLKTMSKMMAIGMTLEDLIERSTAAPAREIGHPELGTLSVGAEADVAILRVDEGDFGFFDCARLSVRGEKELSCVATIRGGRILHDENAHTMPAWEDSEEYR